MEVKNKRPLHGSIFAAGNAQYLFVLAVGFISAFAVMLPYMIYDSGYFLMYGDFNVQQYPFYMHAHDAIRQGAIGWDFKTDLGVNFIGSYSFYNLGSPFFLLTLLLPSGAVPYTIGPLLALKVGFAGMTGYAYIRRFTRYDEFAVLKEYCDRIGICFLSTPFEPESIDFLDTLEMPFWKIPCCTNERLLVDVPYAVAASESLLGSFFTIRYFKPFFSTTIPESPLYRQKID